jgi:hypothetical protein
MGLQIKLQKFGVMTAVVMGTELYKGQRHTRVFWLQQMLMQTKYGVCLKNQTRLILIAPSVQLQL